MTTNNALDFDLLSIELGGVKYTRTFAYGEHQYISPLQVLHSNAGYYVGATYFDRELNVALPYARISGYFKTRKLAERELETENELAREEAEHIAMNGAHDLDCDWLEEEKADCEAHMDFVLTHSDDVPDDEDYGYTAEDVLTRLKEF